MTSTVIFDGNIGGNGVVAFENNAFAGETFKYSFTAQLRCLKPVTAEAGVRMPKMRLFHNALPAMTEQGEAGSDFGVEDVDELGTCMHQEDMHLSPNKCNPDYKWIFKTGCFPADGTNLISWIEVNGLPDDAYHLILWVNEIAFPAAV